MSECSCVPEKWEAIFLYSLQPFLVFCYYVHFYYYLGRLTLYSVEYARNCNIMVTSIKKSMPESAFVNQHISWSLSQTKQNKAQKKVHIAIFFFIDTQAYIRGRYLVCQCMYILYVPKTWQITTQKNIFKKFVWKLKNV